MCGIAGIADPSQEIPPSLRAKLVAGISEHLRHRGPDDAGMWSDAHCTFGHRRLSIIDPSTCGRQPVATLDGRYALTFNGEVYNYRELRSELNSSHDCIRGNTDTEVLLAGLVRHGVAFLDKVDGMYALGFWDSDKRTLLLARDLFGEKPLYWARLGSAIVFGSELDALASTAGIDHKIDTDALAAYLALQYVPAPLTIYQACRKVRPGAFIFFGPDGVARRRRRTVFEPLKVEIPHGIQEQADVLEERLVASLQRRLRSDVPVGAFLSGGIDSALVVALCARHLRRSLDTFTIGFADSASSEHPQAQAFARHLGIPHHLEMVKPADLADAAKIGAKLDEPNADSSCLPTWKLAAFARRVVKVCISGEGGDELFGGYDRYRAICGSVGNYGRKYLAEDMTVFTTEEVTRILGGMPRRAGAHLQAMRRCLDRTHIPLIDRLRILDTLTYLPGAVLTKVDRMSMQHGLEVRTPFLERSVANFAMALSQNSIVSPAQGKVLLRVVAARHYPKTWAELPKMGFAIPHWSWGNESIVEMARRLLEDSQRSLSNWIDVNSALQAIGKHKDPRVFYKAWALIVLNSWLTAHPCRS